MKVPKVTNNIQKRQLQPRNLYLAQGRKADMKLMEQVIRDFGKQSVWKDIRDVVKGFFGNILR